MSENKNLEEFKRELIANIEQRVDDKIIEQTNADLLKKMIQNAETETDAVNIAALGTTYKRTGFHFDKRLEKISNDIKFKSKNEKLSFVNDPERPTHELIIGDNYDALQNLLITHKGKIDVIYIDPPYGKDNMGEFAKTNYDNSITRDNLLSMLYSRLQLAKRLLTPEGVIFCSIDDKNQAYVKCLFDEVFGEENFVETFLWNKTSTPPALSKKSRKTHEYVLCYQRNKNSDPFVGMTNEGGDAPILNESNNIGILKFPANYVQTNLKDGTYKSGYKDRVELMDDVIVNNGVIINEFKLKGRFRWLQNTLDEEIENNCKLIVKSDKFAIRYCREGERSVAPTNFIKEAIYSQDTTIDKPNQGVETNESAGKDLEAILNSSIFAFPKPSSLISYLISFNSKKDSLILDFFAGSGTTGQAVMELNREDGGNRKFILCTNNEITDTNPNGIAYDVTSKRLKRIMSGVCYDGTNDFPWLKNNKPYLDNLNVYNTDIKVVSKTESKPGETAFDKIDETCYGLPKFENAADKIEWVCQNFENATKFLEVPEALREKGVENA